MRGRIRAFLVHTQTTVAEILRGGSTTGILCIWLILLCVGTAFGSVSIGDQIYVIKDFGLFLSSIGTIFLTVASGAALLAKDIKQKHIYTILSKPISRSEYLGAKWMGIWTASLILNVLFHLALVGFVFIIEGKLELSLLYNCLFLACETLVLSALCLLVASLFVTPLLVGVISFFLCIAGRNVQTIDSLLTTIPADSLLSLVLRSVTAILPHLFYCNVVNELTYRIVPSFSFAIKAVIYCCSYATACFIIASKFFSTRNFN